MHTRLEYALDNVTMTACNDNAAEMLAMKITEEWPS